jgi:hypothetical protein
VSSEPHGVPNDDRRLWRGAGSAERLTLLLGPGLFLLFLVGGLAAVIKEWHGMTFGDYMQGVAAGAGLLAVGHGIHRTERMRRNS